MIFSPAALLIFMVGYFVLLLLISRLTSGKADNETFFIANRNSRWYLVAFGMIGTSISGVTFISVPGTVKQDAFSYFQFVLGNAVGYAIIALVLMPVYYRMKLTSIYTYLQHRFGFYSYQSGAFIFLVSRTIGSAFRLFLVAIVLQHYIFDYWHIPFWITVAVSLLLIWTYTYKGGLKTIIWTDTIQTLFLVTAVILTLILISHRMQMGLDEMINAIAQSHYSKIFWWDDFLSDKRHFIKYFLGGVAVSVAMTGLDQDLMQKNLSCRNLREAQKNMFSFTGVFVVINLFFLSLGALLYLYASANHIALPQRADYLFPEIAFHYLGGWAAIVFILGLTAATFATTDSAMTALTTSFCVDFLRFTDRPSDAQKRRQIRIRQLVHLAFSLVFLLVVLFFKYAVSESVVKAVFTVAGYTYGPLLGLFFFGICTRRQVRDKWVPWICVLSPLLCALLDLRSVQWLGGYRFGFELLIVNGILTFAGLWMISQKPVCPQGTQEVQAVAVHNKRD
ncbi:sodium:solute symporter [Thermoflavifilum thermophilum]|uniref:Na+/proline symporter n=1 Tax=Thermoflavifilum thermophilum TaxID=1393122 RepID=A0A1I7NEM0_9BACT|nr:sodium:solute symporter [Thermoflavifilum thermophilum]SFV33127.1 Na+/proline symporter [Thermoflavifilum thermophilum]